jgi:hypothetical protein
MHQKNKNSNTLCKDSDHIAVSLDALSTHQPIATTNKNSSSYNEMEKDVDGLDALTERSVPLSDNNNISINNPAAFSNVVAITSEDPAITMETHEQSSQFYPEGGYGWIVLAATFVITFW